MNYLARGTPACPPPWPPVDSISSLPSLLLKVNLDHLVKLLLAKFISSWAVKYYFVGIVHEYAAILLFCVLVFAFVVVFFLFLFFASLTQTRVTWEERTSPPQASLVTVFTAITERNQDALQTFLTCLSPCTQDDRGAGIIGMCHHVFPFKTDF